MIHRPFFSIVIATYNSFDFIKDCLTSLNSQRNVDFEVIIVDDGSKKEFRNYLKKLSKECFVGGLKIRTFYLEHKGISFARNHGVKKSLGKYIYVLDSDDKLCTNILFKLKNFIKINNYPDLVFGDILIINEKNKIISKRKYRNYLNQNFIRNIFYSLIVPFKHSAISYKRNSFLNLGGYNENFLRLVDVELFLKFLNSKSFILHYPNYLALYRNHSNNISIIRFFNLKFWFLLCDEYCKGVEKIYFKILRIFIETFKSVLIFLNLRR